MQAVIFDFDGTLVDSRSGIKTVVDTLAREHGTPTLSYAQLDELRQLPLHERMKRVGLKPRTLPVLTRRALQLFGDMMHEFPVYDGIPEVLDELRLAGVQTHILSSNKVENIRRCLEANGIGGFASIQSSRGLFGKPGRIRSLLRRLRIPPSSVMYVGDELRDIEASRRSGVPVAAVTWGYDSTTLLEQGYPDYLVHRPSQLVPIILSRCAR